MRVPLTITFRNMATSPAIENEVRDKAAKLAGFSDRITSARVVIETPHRQHRHGALFHVRIDVRGTRKDGTTLQMDVFGFATDIDGEPSVIGNIVDITERREIEDRFRALSENSQVCTSRRTERSST